MQSNLLFIGGGRMARALAGGMLRAGLTQPRWLSVADPVPDALQWWNDHFPGTTLLNTAGEGFAAADVVILAVKPHQVRSVIESINSAHPSQKESSPWKNKLLISVAAGITLEQLTAWVESQRVVRVMPNTPALVGCGASAYCSAPGVAPADKEMLHEWLTAVGSAVEVPEYQMDAVTGLSGSGPAYVFTFIEALADGGVMAGLPRETALKLAIETVRGAAEMVKSTGEHPAALKDAVASPAGTTIAGLAQLEHNAFRGAVIDAVAAAARRSRELQGT